MNSFSRLNKYSFETKEHGILNLLHTLNIINWICLSDVFMIYTDLSNFNINVHKTNKAILFGSKIHFFFVQKPCVEL